MKTGIVMAKRMNWSGLLLIGILLMGGCDTALTVGDKTIGVSSGNFIFTDGYLMTTYNFPLDKVLIACTQTLADMKATEIEKNQRISTGKITATAYDEKIQILVEYMSKYQTSVSVRVGLSGNNIASQLIHDKISGKLMKAAIPEKP
jgi:hypothetical protein